MGESTKAVCALTIIVCAVAAAFAWTATRPDAVAWGFRIGSVLVGLMALGLLLALHFRADIEPDYLHATTGSYFNRDGFCFSIVVTPIDGVAYMSAFFQSQYDRPSRGQIALRPARKFLMGRAKFDAITFEIDCPPAGFGYTRLAIPIPAKYQGKRQSFEVGASVEYPDGKGQRIRFRDGIFLRANTQFKDRLSTALVVAGAASGTLVFNKPAHVKIQLPAGVAEEISNNLPPQTQTLWQLGDPPLEEVA